MTGYGQILHLSGPLRNHHHVLELALSAGQAGVATTPCGHGRMGAPDELSS